jgi:hydrogenase/urease accessory protein HupE
MIKRLAVVLFFILPILPDIALAHTPIAGINNFYNGLLHPFFVPEQLLLILAIGLFLGQRKPRNNKSVIAILVAATGIGLAAHLFITIESLEIYLLIMAALCSVLTAANADVSHYWKSGICLLSGLSLGLDSAQQSLSGVDKLLSLLGSGVGILLLALYLMAFVDYMNKKPWQMTGIRIAGSWIAASSLLTLALSFYSAPYAKH